MEITEAKNTMDLLEVSPGLNPKVCLTGKLTEKSATFPMEIPGVGTIEKTCTVWIVEFSGQAPSAHNTRGEAEKEINARREKAGLKPIIEAVSRFAEIQSARKRAKRTLDECQDSEIKAMASMIVDRCDALASDLPFETIWDAYRAMGDSLDANRKIA